MQFQKTIKNWEGLAQTDMLWSICTNPHKKGGKWQIAEFLAMGETEMEGVFALLKENNVALPDYKKALDFGSGVGRLSAALSKRFEEVVAIDAAPSMLEAGKKLHQNTANIRWVLNQAPNLNVLGEEQFSFIYSSIVLQHIPAPESVSLLQAMLQKLKPQGIMCIQIPVKDVRNLGFFTRLRTRLKLRERLAAVGIGKGFQMNMYCIDDATVKKMIQQNKAILLAEFFTNHTAPDFDGEIKILPPDQIQDFESKLYIIRKEA
ncbi:MAG: class I SAM-dependent methyltransferase [Chitinophagales bacterium]|nr:class I SAM-dependent methyltransferase [Bacteroidota bacterium]